MKKAKKNEEWTRKDEEEYQELCIDDYDEEACYNFVLRHTSDVEFDYGVDEEEREAEEEAEEE